jgi:hypothetical protein
MIKMSFHPKQHFLNEKIQTMNQQYVSIKERLNSHELI